MNLDKIATVAVAAAAVVVASASLFQVLHSIDRTGTGGAVQLSTRAPELVTDAEWAELLETGILIGDRNASVVVAEFVDLECPLCRRSHFALAEAEATFGEDLAYVFIHFPISTHRFAMPAARAAECADAEGRFAEYVDVVFNKQDSLGLKSWTAFALEAGVRDTTRFASCVSETRELTRIQAGLRLGERLNVTATPTVVINGWRLPGSPFESFDDVIEDIRNGRTPLRDAFTDAS